MRWKRWKAAVLQTHKNNILEITPRRTEIVQTPSESRSVLRKQHWMIGLHMHNKAILTYSMIRKSSTVLCFLLCRIVRVKERTVLPTRLKVLYFQFCFQCVCVCVFKPFWIAIYAIQLLERGGGGDSRLETERNTGNRDQRRRHSDLFCTGKSILAPKTDQCEPQHDYFEGSRTELHKVGCQRQEETPKRMPPDPGMCLFLIHLLFTKLDGCKFWPNIR